MTTRVDASAPSTPRWDPRINRPHVAAKVVREYSEIDVPIADLMLPDGRLDLYDAVRQKGYLDVRLAASGALRVSAGHWIGLIPLNPRVTIDVRPRVGIRSIARLIAVSEGDATILPFLLRRYETADEQPESILDALARSLVKSMGEIAQQGIYRTYFARTESTSFPKGRLRLGATATRFLARGMSHVAVCSWFEPTEDNAANRLLRYVLHWLYFRYQRLRVRSARRLLGDINALDQMFLRVPIDYQRRFMDAPEVRDPGQLPTTRSYYGPPIRLAKAILATHGMEPTGRAELLAESVVLDLEALFEGYVRNVLRRELRGEHSVAVFDGNRKPGLRALFDQPPTDRATPDVVLRSMISGEPDIVVEAKYIPREPSRPELNQVITYASVYRAKDVVLIHPASSSTGSGAYRRNTVDDVTYWFYGVDLMSSDLPAVELSLGDFARALMSGTPAGA